VVIDWKISQTFWRSTIFFQKPERKSTKPERLLFSQIHFTSDYLNMVVKLHEGKYEPIISKKLFDKAQEMLKLRGKPDRKAKNEPATILWPHFLRLMRNDDNWRIQG
jgi:hypothetical protein